MERKEKSYSLEKQLYAMLIRFEALTVLLTMVVALYVSLQKNNAMMDSHISSVAALLSTQPEVKQMMLEHRGDALINEQMDSIVDQLSYLDLIGVFDMNGTRLYHIRHDWIGTPMSGDAPEFFFQERTPCLVTTHGDLGNQRRAFHPVFNEEGEMIGYVVAGIMLANSARSTLQLIALFALIAVLLILLGRLLVGRLYGRLCKILLGYAPEQLSHFFLATTDVINSLEEGILAVDTQDRVVATNAAAQRLLNLFPAPQAGTPLSEVFPEGKLPRIPNVLVSDVPLSSAQNGVRTVYILRDHQETTKLAERLMGAENMVDTLRAFNHEFKNKLHVILGFLQMNDIQSATRFITGTSLSSTEAVSVVMRRIHTPAIAALLIGKIVRSDELGIRLTLQPESDCSDKLPVPTDVYITILGNLIENAMEELNSGENRAREISVCVVAGAQGSMMTVDDTGRGIPKESIDSIFDRGFSTKGSGRGMGLSLVQDAVREYGGSITVDSDEGIGSSITVTLPPLENVAAQR